MPAVKSVRVLGGMAAAELHPGGSAGRDGGAAAGGYFDELGSHLYREFMQRDILLRPLGNVLYVLPPYVVEDQDVERIFDTVVEVVGASQPWVGSRHVRRSWTSRGVQQDDFAYAVTWFAAAKELDSLSPEILHQLNFWHGYSILRPAILEQEPRTLEVARTTLPKFQQALELLSDVGEYPSTVNVDVQQQQEAVQTYIEIQEAIIRRGS